LPAFAGRAQSRLFAPRDETPLGDLARVGQILPGRSPALLEADWKTAHFSVDWPG